MAIFVNLQVAEGAVPIPCCFGCTEMCRAPDGRQSPYQRTLEGSAWRQLRNGQSKFRGAGPIGARACANRRLSAHRFPVSGFQLLINWPAILVFVYINFPGKPRTRTKAHCPKLPWCDVLTCAMGNCLQSGGSYKPLGPRFIQGPENG